jgi:hypothetical protein
VTRDRGDHTHTSAQALALPAFSRRLALSMAALLTVGLALAQPLGAAWAGDDRTAPASPCVQVASASADDGAGAEISDGADGLLLVDATTVRHSADGCTWTPVFDVAADLPDLAEGVEILAAAASAGPDTLVILVATNHGPALVTLVDGAWLLRATALTCDAGCALAADDAHLFAVDGGALVRSDDDGDTWQPLVLPDGAVVETVTIDADGALQVSGEATLLRSTDGGLTFEAAEVPVEESPVEVLPIEVDALPVEPEFDQVEVAGPPAEIPAAEDLGVDQVVAEVVDAVPAPPDDVAIEVALPGPSVDAAATLVGALPQGEAILIGARPSDALESADDEPAHEVEDTAAEEPVDEPAPEPVPAPESVAEQSAALAGPAPEVAAGALAVREAPHPSTLPAAAQMTAGLAAAALLGLLALSLLPRVSPVAARVLGLAPRRR